MTTNSPGKEQALRPERSARPLSRATTDKVDERMLATLDAASEKKAIDTIVLDLREVASFTDYFVITSGANERQVQAISDEVLDRLKKMGEPAARVEGYQSAEWILLDCGDFVVHVFDEKARKFFDLERLWRDAKRVELPAAPGTGNVSSLRSQS